MAKRIVVKKESHECVGGPFSGTLLYLSTQSTFWFKCGRTWHGRYVSTGDGRCHWEEKGMKPIEELRDLAARALGWVDFPTDSIENGSIWHLQKSTAPFGSTINKSLWLPDVCATQSRFLEVELLMTVCQHTTAVTAHVGSVLVQVNLENGISRHHATKLAVLNCAANLFSCR